MTGRDSPPCALTPKGVRLAVRLTPRANRTGLDGIVAADPSPTAQAVART